MQYFYSVSSDYHFLIFYNSSFLKKVFFKIEFISQLYYYAYFNEIYLIYYCMYIICVIWNTYFELHLELQWPVACFKYWDIELEKEGQVYSIQCLAFEHVYYQWYIFPILKWLNRDPCFVSAMNHIFIL